MSCDQKSLVQRLAVESPAALNEPSWQSHLEACPECRRERYELARSLAVFRQFEAEGVSPNLSGPSWDSFSRALARSRRRGLGGARLRAPLAAASLLAAVSTGVLLWPIGESPTQAPRPAKIVRLAPAHELHLERVLRTTLGDPDVPAGGRSSHDAPTPPEPAPAKFVVRNMEPQGSQAQAGALVSVADAAPAARSTGTRPEPAPVPAREVQRASAPAVAAEPIPERPQYTSPFARSSVASREGERAPVLLFRSLQQRRTRRPPIQVLPAVSPMPAESGSSFLRSLVTPRPIR